MYNYSQPIIWVNGEEGAKAYMVSPNHTVALWDSETQTIYLKSADNVGRATIQYLDYTVRDIPKSEDIFKDLQEKVASLEEQIKSMTKGKRKNEPVVSENESE